MSMNFWTHTGTIDFNERDLAAITQFRSILLKSKLRPFQWKLGSHVPQPEATHSAAWIMEAGCRDDNNVIKYVLAWVYWSDRADIEIDDYQVSTKEYNGETGEVTWVGTDHKLKGVK